MIATFSSATESDRSAFIALAAALRELQAAVSSSCPGAEVSEEVATRFAAASALLTPFGVGTDEQLSGQLWESPGRGQAMVPPFVVESVDSQHIRGQVTLSRFYQGAAGSAHGGVVALVMNEILGTLANRPEGPMRIAAYLHIDFRSSTPLGQPLIGEAHVDREEGRKLYLVGTLAHGEKVVAEAQGLFLAPRPA